jgi:hypothetical protein
MCDIDRGCYISADCQSAASGGFNFRYSLIQLGLGA